MLKVAEVVIKQPSVVRHLVEVQRAQALKAQQTPGRRNAASFIDELPPLVRLLLSLSPIQTSAAADAARFCALDSQTPRLGGSALAQGLGKAFPSAAHFLSLGAYPRASQRDVLIAVAACGDQLRHMSNVLAKAFMAQALLGSVGSEERKEARNNLLGWIAAVAALGENVVGIVRDPRDRRAVPDAFMLNLVRFF